MAGLYIHVPFCSKSCPYCDYYHKVCTTSTVRFTAALCSELESAGRQFGSAERFSSVYIGGGTPSRLSSDELRAIIAAVFEDFDIAADAEITIEANPEDISPETARTFQGLGVNRCVVGVQSFYQSDLDFLGRAHKEDDILKSLDALRYSGITNIAVDLMLAIPGQPREYWAANLERVANLEIPHISTYELTIEANSNLAQQLHNQKVAAVTPEDRADQMVFTMEYLRSRGYRYYELTNYALDGYESQHAGLYSDHGNVVGVGPSAYSFWWYQLPQTGVRRWVTTRDLHRYITGVTNGESVVDENLMLDPDELAQEYVLIRLRTESGIDLEKLEVEYGYDLLTERVEELAELESEELIQPIRNNRLRLTDKGRLLADTISGMLTP